MRPIYWRLLGWIAFILAILFFGASLVAKNYRVKVYFPNYGYYRYRNPYKYWQFPLIFLGIALISTSIAFFVANAYFARSP